MDENLNEGEGSVYELGFLLVPEITEEKLPEAFGAIKDVVVKHGGTPISEEFPKNMALAYTIERTFRNKIERYNEAFFSWIKFELGGEAVKALDAELRLRGDVVRFLIVKTVRENTMSAKRPMGIRRKAGAPKEKDPNAPEMSKEEIDREIDALVVDKENA